MTDINISGGGAFVCHKCGQFDHRADQHECEPRTDGLVKELLNTDCHKCSDYACDCKSLYEYIIHRAQEHVAQEKQIIIDRLTRQIEKEQQRTFKARHEAIEECLEIAIDGSLIEDRIRALLEKK